MMMVDNVVALLRPQHDWDHVAANERPDLLWFLLAQAFAFFLDLAHADSDLGGTQAFDRDRLQNRLARVSHGFLPAIASSASNHHRSSRSTRHKYSSSGPRIAAKASPHARSIAVDGESPRSDRCQICHLILRRSFGTAMPPSGSYVPIRHGRDAGRRRKPR